MAVTHQQSQMQKSQIKNNQKLKKVLISHTYLMFVTSWLVCNPQMVFWGFWGVTTQPTAQRIELRPPLRDDAQLFLPSNLQIWSHGFWGTVVPTFKVQLSMGMLDDEVHWSTKVYGDEW